MPKLTIDGNEIEVEDGLNLIQAAARIGIDIPHFCYHPALSVVAQCRQCLVEVEGVPKVMPACNTFVREGLIVKTNSEKAIKARKATVEFTLINHPLDCPICDKGGECPLQLTTFKHGPGYSRFDGPEEKKVRRKYYLSDRIVYDPNRCIMCTRCVRFTDEITKTGELGYSGRGFRKRIVVFPGKTLDNELAGNVIDLCPVGALLSRDTLHEERVWYWRFTDTVCPLCSNGCNITVGADPRKGRISRIRPRVNPEVNEYWICDTGRYGFKGIQEEKRLKEPIIRVGEGFETTAWDKAIGLVLEGISRIKSDSPYEVAFIGSPILTNEELYLLKKLAGILGIDNVTSNAGRPVGEKRFGLISPDPFPNSRGVRDMGLASDSNGIGQVMRSILEGRIKALFVVGEDLFQIISQEERARLVEALSKLPFLGVEDFRLTETVKMAHVILPGASPYEKDGTFTNDRGRVQRVRKAISPPGDAKPDWEVLTLIGRRIQKEGFKYRDPSQIMIEISERFPSYKGINYDKIGVLGINRRGDLV
ncbi:MAG TPA: molybdopterin-dependent oxidoreductase [Thermodesulfobacteriota bacterium]|nr:molybdopterin-dependent oxidoreductase [Thermodesulfobacteriota bacterium]